MRRREFIATVSGVAVGLPIAVNAQSNDRLRRIAVLMPLPSDNMDAQARLKALRKGMRHVGWVQDYNVLIDVFWCNDGVKNIDQVAAALVLSKPDLIVASASPSVSALKQMRTVIPIVFVQVTDPVSQGFVISLAKPGGNITGFSQFEYSVAAKWLTLLLELLPTLSRVEVLTDPEQPTTIGYTRELAASCIKFGIDFIEVPIRTESDVKKAFENRDTKSNTAMIMLPGPSTNRYGEQIQKLAQLYRLPMMSGQKDSVAAGGLASYGVDTYEMYERAGEYIDKILNGAKAGDLPVQLSNKLHFAINLKTAKEIGLSVPLSILTLADEVIE